MIDHHQAEMIRNILRLEYEEQIPREVLDKIEMLSLICRSSGLPLRMADPTLVIMSIMMCGSSKPAGARHGHEFTLTSRPDARARFLSAGPVNLSMVLLDGEKRLVRTDELVPLESAQPSMS